MLDSINRYAAALRIAGIKMEKYLGGAGAN